MKRGDRTTLILVLLILCAVMTSMVLVWIALRRMSFGPAIGIV
jgi:hypothetical protein